jgi:ribosomal protein S18 acetylase RimI-like enzyme
MGRPRGRFATAQYARAVGDDDLRRNVWRGIAAFQRLLGRYGPGPEPLERDAFVASSLPEVPASLVNAAVPLDGAPLAPHLTEIARFYDQTPKWGAWIDPASTEDADALTSRGLVLDSWPVLMAAALDKIAPPDLQTSTEQPSMAEVGAVNDAAYGNPPGVIESAMAAFPTHAAHAYTTKIDEQPASVALIIDVDDDAFVTMVATLPQHRGRRLASNLLAHALEAAKNRGRTTTSLQASPKGQNVYARLGYRPLGEAHLYEMRPG